MQRDIIIIGSTGSIGKNAVQIINRFSKEFKTNLLVAHSNYQLLAKQAALLRPVAIIILNEQFYQPLLEECEKYNLDKTIVRKKEDLNNFLKKPNQNILVANNGIAALDYILTAISGNNIISLANKEALVSAGKIINTALQKSSSKIIPVDSEHNAIYQLIKRQPAKSIHKLILTASGGPFYNHNDNELENVAIGAVMQHPTWHMGPEICVNCATLVNKGLELIEAYYLFGQGNSDFKSKIHAIYHPQSIVHGMLQFIDGTLDVSAAPNSMQIPIAYALANEEKLDLSDLVKPPHMLVSNLIFEEIKPAKARALNLAKEVLISGGNRPCVYNVSNEVAIREFLSNKIKFTNIINVIDYTLNKVEYVEIRNVHDVNIQSELAANIAGKYIKQLT